MSVIGFVIANCIIEVVQGLHICKMYFRPKSSNLVQKWKKNYSLRGKNIHCWWYYAEETNGLITKIFIFLQHDYERQIFLSFVVRSWQLAAAKHRATSEKAPLNCARTHCCGCSAANDRFGDACCTSFLFFRVWCNSQLPQNVLYLMDHLGFCPCKSVSHIQSWAFFFNQPTLWYLKKFFHVVWHSLWTKFYVEIVDFPPRSLPVTPDSTVHHIYTWRANFFSSLIVQIKMHKYKEISLFFSWVNTHHSQ